MIGEITINISAPLNNGVRVEVIRTFQSGTLRQLLSSESLGKDIEDTMISAVEAIEKVRKHKNAEDE